MCCVWLMSLCSEAICVNEKPGSVFDFHFIGLVYVSPCWHMYSRVAVVNYSHVLSRRIVCQLHLSPVQMCLFK